MRGINSLKRILLWLPLLCASTFPTAASSQSLGQIAQQIAAPVQQATYLLQTICLICGIALIMGALLKYKAHRNNPQEVPFSTPLMLLLFGLALVALAVVPPMITGNK